MKNSNVNLIKRKYVKNNKCKKFFLMLTIFVYLYFPPICKLNTVYFLGVLGWGYLIIKRKNIETRYLRTMCLMLGISIYLFLMNHGGIVSSKTYLGLLYIVLLSMPCAYMIALLVDSYGMNLKDLISIIICCGTLQGIFALLSFLIPEIQTFFLFFLGYVFDANIIESLKSMRLFGYANDMTFAMPIVQSVLAVFTTFYAFHVRHKYYFLVPIILLAGFLNARTSMIIFAIGVFFIVIDMNILKKKNAEKAIVGMFIAIILIVLFTTFLSGSESMKFITEGLNEIVALFKGERIGYFSYFTGEIDSPVGLLEIPSGIGFWFGRGENIRTDVGYINDFWRGGLFYIFSIYGMYFYIILYSIKKIIRENRTKKLITIFCIVVLLISNIKGYIFDFNTYSQLIILIYASAIVLTKRKKSNVRISICNHTGV